MKASSWPITLVHFSIFFRDVSSTTIALFTHFSDRPFKITRFCETETDDSTAHVSHRTTFSSPHVHPVNSIDLDGKVWSRTNYRHSTNSNSTHFPVVFHQRKINRSVQKKNDGWSFAMSSQQNESTKDDKVYALVRIKDKSFVSLAQFRVFLNLSPFFLLIIVEIDRVSRALAGCIITDHGIDTFVSQRCPRGTFPLRTHCEEKAVFYPPSSWLIDWFFLASSPVV